MEPRGAALQIARPDYCPWRTSVRSFHHGRAGPDPDRQGVARPAGRSPAGVCACRRAALPVSEDFGRPLPGPGHPPGGVTAVTGSRASPPLAPAGPISSALGVGLHPLLCRPSQGPTTAYAAAPIRSRLTYSPSIRCAGKKQCPVSLAKRFLRRSRSSRRTRCSRTHMRSAPSIARNGVE
jgi:hypothetical protein